MLDVALPANPAEKSRMSRATKPRKLDELDASAPWPTSWMIGPWWAGSLFGLRASKSIPADGMVRFEVKETESLQAVLAVETRSWNECVLPSHGDTPPPTAPGALV